MSIDTAQGIPLSTQPSASLIGAATAMTDRALRGGLDRDWSVRAGDLDWSCHRTAAHIADDLFSYASQVVASPSDGYLPVEATLDPEATPEDLLRAIAMCAELLRLAVSAASPGQRAWHPNGISDPEGFGAMGIVEMLVHTHDITQGLGLEWTPPSELSAPVLARLFPDAPAGNPSDVLLWCTGRAALPNHPRRSQWHWDSTVRS